MYDDAVFTSRRAMFLIYNANNVKVNTERNEKKNSII